MSFTPSKSCEPAICPVAGLGSVAVSFVPVLAFDVESLIDVPETSFRCHTPA